MPTEPRAESMRGEVPRVCNTRGREDCSNMAQFSVTAEGYPAAMYPGVCADHLGPLLASDAQTGGSTCRWIVVAL